MPAINLENYPLTSLKGNPTLDDNKIIVVVHQDIDMCKLKNCI